MTYRPEQGRMIIARKLFIGLSVLLLVAAACGESEPEATSAATTAAPVTTAAPATTAAPDTTAAPATTAAPDTTAAPPERATVRIALDFIPNTNHAGIFIARSMGLFERENLDVEVVPWAFTVTGVLVEAGDADLGIAYPPDLLREVALGSSLKIVAAIIQENNVALVVPADSPYQTAADLGAAESYGGYGTPHERPLVTEMLTAAGAATPGDFQEVVLQGGAIEALIEDRVEFSAVFQGWSEIAARLRGTELRLFPYVDFIPEIVYPDVVFIARSEMIEQQPDVLARALRALGEAYTFAAENPDQAADILISEVTDLEQSEPLVRESAHYRAAQYLNDDGVWGCVQTSHFAGIGGLLERSGVLLDEEGQVVTAPEFSVYATSELLPDC